MQTANVSFLKVSLVALALTMFTGFGVPMRGQGTPTVTVGNSKITGLPDDWSHHRVVFPDPGTAEDAMRKGTYDHWQKIVNDPRYVMQQLKLGLPVRGPASEDVDFRNSVGKWLAKSRTKAISTELHRDWAVSLGAGGVAQGMYPAKWSSTSYTYPTDFSMANCSTDYAVFPINHTTGYGRAHVVATFSTIQYATGTNFSVTVTPTGGTATTLTLTASLTLNTGTNFQVFTAGSRFTNDITEAANLAAAINRNLSGTALGEVAAINVAGANTVTIYALTPGTRVVLTDSTNVSNLSFGTVTAGTNGTQANIAGFNQLYSGTGTPLCTGLTFPEFIFSYASGVGPIATSPILSMDGTEVAYLENDPNMGAILHVLTFASGSTEYGTCTNSGTAAPTCATAPVVPGSSAGSTGVDYMLPLSLVANGTDTYSSPFVNYSADIGYVGDDNGFLYAITPFFNGTPAKVGGNFPITVNAAGDDLSSPVVDVSGTGNIIVGDQQGYLHNYTSAGVAAGTALQVGGGTANTTAGGVRDSPLVDSDNSVAYAVNGCTTTTTGHSALEQFGFTTSTLTAKATATLSTEGCTGPAPMYSPTPDNNYFVNGISSSTPANNGEIVACYTGSGTVMDLGQYQFTSGAMNTAAEFTNAFLAHGGAFECSPLSEFYNSNTAFTVTALTQTLNTVTVTTSSNSFTTGNSVTMAGVAAGSGGCNAAAVADINGAQTITRVSATQFTFTSGLSTTIASGSCGLTSATATAPADLLFFGVNYTTPEAYTYTLPLTSATQAATATNTTSVSGGTSAMIIDNDASSGQASSVYFGTLATSTGVCGTTVYCAVKLTQSALQ